MSIPNSFKKPLNRFRITIIEKEVVGLIVKDNCVLDIQIKWGYFIQHLIVVERFLKAKHIRKINKMKAE